MKSFMKFIVTVLVVAVVGYIAYYLVINNTGDTDTSLSGDLELDNKFENLSGEIVDNDSEEIENSGNVSGEVFGNESGEEVLESVIDPKVESINRINEQVLLINSGEVLSTISENLTSDLVSESAREFMTYFKVNELPATINIKEKCVEIIPVSDFIENMVYYYDENGNLILYESVSNTVGGSSKYYFENGASIDVVWDYDEEIEKQEEYVFAVLGRAQVIYDRYLKK